MANRKHIRPDLEDLPDVDLDLWSSPGSEWDLEIEGYFPDWETVRGYLDRGFYAYLALCANGSDLWVLTILNESEEDEFETVRRYYLENEDRYYVRLYAKWKDGGIPWK